MLSSQQGSIPGHYQGLKVLIFHIRLQQILIANEQVNTIDTKFISDPEQNHKSIVFECFTYPMCKRKYKSTFIKI